MEEKDKLIYIADPMCSWCYGFSPEITKIKEKYDGQLDFQLVMGGLRPGGTEKMDEKFKKFLEHHWITINKRTGQPFKYEILDDQSIVYDTEPAARAVVTTRLLHPEKEFQFFKAVQTAFYAENKNTTIAQTFIDMAEAHGMDKEKYAELFYSDAMRNETKEDFMFSRELQVTGFPTLVLKKGDEYHYISAGFDDGDKLIKKIEKELEKE